MGWIAISNPFLLIKVKEPAFYKKNSIFVLSIQNNFVPLHHNKTIGDKEMKKYWLINVSVEKNGYSMVVLTDKETEKDVLLAAYDNDLFDQDEDIEYATAELADDDTIEHFKENNLINEL